MRNVLSRNLARVLRDRQRVQVDDAVERVGLVLVTTQLRIAPSKLPRWTSPVGWMPENTRAMGGDRTQGGGDSARHCAG